MNLEMGHEIKLQNSEIERAKETQSTRAHKLENWAIESLWVCIGIQ
jgi:hypothetical protein